MTYPLVYIAGPYRAATAWQVEQNIRAAEEVGYRIAQAGAYPVIPHSNTRAYFESAGPAELWLGGTLELMRRCDAAVFLPRWTESKGARAERAEAERLGIAVFGVGHLNGGTFANWVKKRLRSDQSLRARQRPPILSRGVRVNTRKPSTTRLPIVQDDSARCRR